MPPHFPSESVPHFARNPQAENGDANAQCDLGTTYANAQGTSHDYEEASRWWRKAAAQGNLNAQIVQ
jgi:TPR repeat protein